MYQPLIKFHPHPAIFTQVLCIFAVNCEHILHSLRNIKVNFDYLARLLLYLQRNYISKFK